MCWLLAQFAGLLVDKLLDGLVPLGFIAFAAVGALGVLVNLAVLTVALKLGRVPFDHLPRPTAARRAAVARPDRVHAGLRTWGGGGYRHRPRGGRVTGAVVTVVWNAVDIPHPAPSVHPVYYSSQRQSASCT